jgi:hypothetical protein
MGKKESKSQARALATEASGTFKDEAIGEYAHAICLAAGIDTRDLGLHVLVGIRNTAIHNIANL